MPGVPVRVMPWYGGVRRSAACCVALRIIPKLRPRTQATGTACLATHNDVLLDPRLGFAQPLALPHLRTHKR